MVPTLPSAPSLNDDVIRLVIDELDSDRLDLRGPDFFGDAWQSYRTLMSIQGTCRYLKSVVEPKLKRDFWIRADNLSSACEFSALLDSSRRMNAIQHVFIDSSVWRYTDGWGNAYAQGFSDFHEPMTALEEQISRQLRALLSERSNLSEITDRWDMFDVDTWTQDVRVGHQASWIGLLLALMPCLTVIHFQLPSTRQACSDLYSVLRALRSCRAYSRPHTINIEFKATEYDPNLIHDTLKVIFDIRSVRTLRFHGLQTARTGSYWDAEVRESGPLTEGGACIRELDLNDSMVNCDLLDRLLCATRKLEAFRYSWTKVTMATSWQYSTGATGQRDLGGMLRRCYNTLRRLTLDARHFNWFEVTRDKLRPLDFLKRCVKLEYLEITPVVLVGKAAYVGEDAFEDDDEFDESWIREIIQPRKLGADIFPAGLQTLVLHSPNSENLDRTLEWLMEFSEAWDSHAPNLRMLDLMDWHQDIWNYGQNSEVFGTFLVAVGNGVFQTERVHIPEWISNICMRNEKQSLAPQY